MMTVEFQLPGCGSLKDKRKRLRGLKDRFGKIGNLAVTESDLHDVHQRAQWSFVVIGRDSTGLEQTLDTVENFVLSQLDAVVVASERQSL